MPRLRASRAIPGADAADPQQRRLLGRIMGVFGIRGEVRFRNATDEALGLAPQTTVIVEHASQASTLTWLGYRRHHDRLLAHFAEFDAPEAAQPYVGADVYVTGEAPALGESEYLDADLIGLVLVDPLGARVGRVVAVEHYPAQDCLVVGERRSLVPLVSAFVRGIDVAGGTISVDLPPGLLDDAEAEDDRDA